MTTDRPIPRQPKLRDRPEPQPRPYLPSAKIHNLATRGFAQQAEFMHRLGDGVEPFLRRRQLAVSGSAPPASGVSCRRFALNLRSDFHSSIQ